MDEQYLPEFAGTYLEDSYFLGVAAEGANLRLKFLFALTADHANYAAPKPGEQHCYREGSIVIEQPSIVDWQPGRPALIKDLNGVFDFGGVELYSTMPGRFRFVTEWFDATVETDELRLELADADA